LRQCVIRPSTETPLVVIIFPFSPLSGKHFLKSTSLLINNKNNKNQQKRYWYILKRYLNANFANFKTYTSENVIEAYH